VAEVFGSQLAVLFDRGLLNTSPAPANWTMSFHGESYTCESLQVYVNQIIAEMRPLGIDPGPARCAYAASPPDVLALNSVPAAPFTDFPIT